MDQRTRRGMQSGRQALPTGGIRCHLEPLQRGEPVAEDSSQHDGRQRRSVLAVW